MRIVALDIATRCGIAIGTAGEKPVAYSVDLGRGKSEDHRFSACLSLVSKLLAEHKPGLLAIEAPVGGRETSHYLVGLVACARGVAMNRGVRVETVTSAAARKHFIGHVPAVRDFPGMTKDKAKIEIKRIVQARCRALGWDHDDLDGCDALAIWDFSAATWGRSQATPLGGLFRGACAAPASPSRKERTRQRGNAPGQTANT